MPDTKITAEVIDKLTFEPGLNPHNIMVFVKDGAVTLDGAVPTYTEKHTAEQAAKCVRGVINVINELIVKLDDSHQRNDFMLTTNIVNALVHDSSIMPTAEIEATVENGTVTLTGEVDNRHQKKRAEKCIKRLHGIINIINNIKIKPIKMTVDPKLVSTQIMREFQRNACLEAKNIYVNVDKNKVILKGTVRSWAEKKEAKKAAWSVNGVNEVQDELLLSYVA